MDAGYDQVFPSEVNRYKPSRRCGGRDGHDGPLDPVPEPGASWPAFPRSILN